MASKTGATLYDEVTRITYQYLGPAADRFVTRQIKSHLHKEPHQIREKDLSSLIDWIMIAMNLLSDDQKLVSEYIIELRHLLQD